MAGHGSNKLEERSNILLLGEIGHNSSVEKFIKRRLLENALISYGLKISSARQYLQLCSWSGARQHANRRGSTEEYGQGGRRARQYGGARWLGSNV